MNKRLTVTVPAYNVERYLTQCLESFVSAEGMEELEVLVIDDGSTDRTAEIAQEFVEKYPQTFRLIQKENGGHGSAVNRGILEAKGEYFKVVDSDDWVDKRAFRALLEALRRCGSDLVYSNYYWVRDKNGKKRAEFEKPFEMVEFGKQYRLEDIGEELFLKMHGFTIKTALLKKIPSIDEHCFYVDMEFVLFPVPYIETVTFIPDFVYMYRIGAAGQSMSSQKLGLNAKHYDRVLHRLFSFYRQQRADGLGRGKLLYLEHVLARMTVSRIKIFLCFPYSREIENEIRRFDQAVRKQYPEVYRAVQNRAVLLMRRTGYRSYGISRFAYYWKERLS